MQIRTELSERPPAFTVVKEGTDAVIVFYTDVTEVQRAEKTAYEAVSWTMRRPWADGLQTRISANTAVWFEQAKTEACAEAAAEVRAARNKLLADTDAEMCMDRMGLNIPENITAASMLGTVADVFAALRKATAGDMAAYRQALRDVTDQAGFPYDVVWPVKPKSPYPV